MARDICPRRLRGRPRDHDAGIPARLVDLCAAAGERDGARECDGGGASPDRDGRHHVGAPTVARRLPRHRVARRRFRRGRRGERVGRERKWRAVAVRYRVARGFAADRNPRYRVHRRGYGRTHAHRKRRRPARSRTPADRGHTRGARQGRGFRAAQARDSGHRHARGALHRPHEHRPHDRCVPPEGRR